MKRKLSLIAFGLMLLVAFAGQAQQLEDINDSTLVDVAVLTDADFIPDVSDAEIQARLKQIENVIKLTYHPRVRSFIDYFTVRDRDYTRRMLERQNLYFPLFEKYLAEYGLPDELKYLAIVESGLNPKAISRASAVGLWQFMAPTARIDYKLKIDWFLDERMDPEKSTRAACQYLAFLYRSFGDWHLALAAYNTGPGNIRKAMRRSGKNTFWGIYDYIHKDTRAYVPQFIAVTYAMSFAEEHNLFVENKLYAMETEKVPVTGFCNLQTFANLSGICYEDLLALNPEVKRGVLPDYVKNYPLIVPVDKAAHLKENLLAILDSASANGQKQMEALAKYIPSGTHGKEKMVYKVKSGDALSTIAAKHGVRVNDLKEWNQLNSNTIRIGQNLTIWLDQAAYQKSTTTVQSKSNPIIAQTLPSSKTYIVQPGDTLWKISQQYQGLTIEKIKQLNNLKDNNIKPGQTLKIG